MNPSDRDYLLDMLDITRTITPHITTIDRQAYDSSDILKAAFRYWLITLGEAANHVSSATRQAAPMIEWQRVIALRHRLAHDYIDIDDDILWVILTVNVPNLQAQV